jgi:hypothetical protein
MILFQDKVQRACKLLLAPCYSHPFPVSRPGWGQCWRWNFEYSKPLKRIGGNLVVVFQEKLHRLANFFNYPSNRTSPTEMRTRKMALEVKFWRTAARDVAVFEENLHRLLLCVKTFG